MRAVFLCLVVLSVSGFGDGCNYKHSCVKPVISQGVDMFEYDDKYNEEVKVYKKCMQDFVNEQITAIKKHTQAKKEAIVEWNEFVKEN